MTDVNDMSLLREYRSGSEEAFTELVRRHVNLVYSVALRHTRNPTHAEEITQVVFAILARKAGSISPNAVLEGWLHQTTRFTAIDLIRRERRRQIREQKACMESSLQSQPDHSHWNDVAPSLDEALSCLNNKDRDAVILRYFKDRSVRDVADALGVNENAAQQRILRAVEKLRRFLSRRGVVVPAAALAAVIAAHSVQAAPVALAESTAVFAVAKATAASTSTLTLLQGALKTMAWTKIKIGIAGAVIAAAVIVPFAIQQRAQARALALDTALRDQSEQLARARADHDRLAKSPGAGPSQNSYADLEKIRAEIAGLRQQSNDVAQLQIENKNLRAQNGLDRPKSDAQIQAETRVKMNDEKQWLLQFMIYAQSHDGQIPTNFDQPKAELASQNDINTNLATDPYEIVYSGNLNSLTNAADLIVLREKESWNADSAGQADQWMKTYGFADGHVEVHHGANNNFDDYEAQHIIPPPSQ